MVTATSSVNYSPGQWRRPILAHCGSQSIAARAGFVAASFIGGANKSTAFVNIERASAVLLFEECSVDHARPQRVPLRLVSYRASRVPQGVQWGGKANSQLFKDLTLTPHFGARGQRIDKRKAELLSLALKLDRRLSRAARHPAAPWPTLRLPRLWAGFYPHHVHDLYGEGPEFEEACYRKNESPPSMLRAAVRTAYGLALYPLDWISNQLERAAAVFAELTPSLRRQVFRLEQLPRDLIGFQGACAFDFFNSRYRRMSYGTNVTATTTTTPVEHSPQSCPLRIIPVDHVSAPTRYVNCAV